MKKIGLMVCVACTALLSADMNTTPKEVKKKHMVPKMDEESKSNFAQTNKEHSGIVKEHRDETTGGCLHVKLICPSTEDIQKSLQTISREQITIKGVKWFLVNHDHNIKKASPIFKELLTSEILLSCAYSDQLTLVRTFKPSTCQTVFDQCKVVKKDENQVLKIEADQDIFVAKTEGLQGSGHGLEIVCPQKGR